MAQHGRERAKKGGSAWRVVFVIALLVFVCSSVALGVMAYSYLQGQMKYNDVAKNSGLDTSDIAKTELAEVKVDWDALLSVNPDTVAWLYVPNTRINYPVVRGDDNDYYLTHSFEGDAGWLANYGTVFMDCKNNPDWSDQSYFIYGHHMNDGSMFADLVGLTDQARFDECRTLYLLTPNGNFKLRSFAMLHTEVEENLVQMNFATPAEMEAYVQDKIDQSEVSPGDIPAAADITKTFALFTCDNISVDGRYILYAYIAESSAAGLTGNLGLEQSGGQTSGFDNDLMMSEGAQEAAGQDADRQTESRVEDEAEEGAEEVSEDEA